MPEDTQESPVFERFLSLAKRELGADDVRLLRHGETTPEAANVLISRLSDGRHVVASFGEAPRDRDALERRLSMLASTFAEALAAPPSERTRARQPVATSLHEELKALAFRAQALDVVVIDGNSPVVWGCASVPARPRARNDLLLRDVSARELTSSLDGDESGPLHDAATDPSPTSRQDVRAESSPDIVVDEPPEPEATRVAVAALRRLPSLELLHKGRHLRHVERDGTFFLAVSFSGIYLLCMVFEGDFDELRAERAAHESLPRIERLVLALPPLDPDPQASGGVVALRRPRKR